VKWLEQSAEKNNNKTKYHLIFLLHSPEEGVEPTKPSNLRTAKPIGRKNQPER
jgi:hypothetical protein